MSGSPSQALGAPAGSGENSTQFLVAGMTCSHCVRSITEEVCAIDGVSDVEVELHTGGRSKLLVTSTVPVDPELVREAVEEAGYSLVNSA